jgi:RHS repeat-associated protein
MRDDSGQTAFGYDGFGRLISKTQSVAGTTVRTFKVGYAYGASGASTGHVSSVTYPSGSRINIDYDSSGRPHSLRLLAPGAAQPVFLLSEITYRPFGAVSGWTWGDGASQSSTYTRIFDLEGNLVSYPLGYPGKNGVIRTLHYDAAGRITGTTHTGTVRAGALDQTYQYDDLDRLTGFDATGTSQRYAYDQNGNRSQITFGSVSYAYTLSATSNRVDATAGPAPRKINTYDKAGNLTGDGTISYTYDANGRMETASAFGVTTRYRYNGRGERVVKASSAASTYYVYDEQGHLLGEYDATGRPVQETVYLGDPPVVVIKPGVSGPAVYYVYADHLHAPRVLTRASDQQIVWRWDHADPFGLLPPDENPSGLGTFTYDLRFPGQVFDKETNNHYNYFRDYDPQLGRYIQSDPVGLNGGPNTYSYVYGQPLKLQDPKGLFGFPMHVSITNQALGNDTSFPGLGLNVAGVDFIPGLQDPENSYMHAMRDGTTNQSVAAAQTLYNQYIASQIATCTQLGLARALHAAEDAAAGGHAGFQPWMGGVPSTRHMWHDFFPSDADVDQAVRNAKAIIARYKRQCPCSNTSGPTPSSGDPGSLGYTD